MVAIFEIVFAAVFAEFFGIGQMTSDTMFGLKIVAVVMLYGYMHMNLGSGMLSTVAFLIFAYFFIFYANGMMALIVLVLFFLMMHGFDVLWGGQIVQGELATMKQARMAHREAMMQQGYRPMLPPPI
jgi:hypothetical protein